MIAFEALVALLSMPHFTLISVVEEILGNGAFQYLS